MTEEKVNHEPGRGVGTLTRERDGALTFTYQSNKRKWQVGGLNELEAQDLLGLVCDAYMDGLARMRDLVTNQTEINAEINAEINNGEKPERIEFTNNAYRNREPDTPTKIERSWGK